MGLPLAIGIHGSSWADQLGWSGPSPGMWSRRCRTCGSSFTPVFVVFVFVVFVCVYWRLCLCHPVGTPSGWLPSERGSYLRLGSHLSKKKVRANGPFSVSLSLSLSLCLSASLPLCLSASLPSRPLCLSVSLSLSRTLFLSFSLSISQTHTHSLLVWYVPCILSK